jgi:glucosamine 6-phosphate synthetase-like amidotransferase/phosphosugar isomerase protein
MCGIAGYSLSPRSSVDRTLAAQSLLAAIAERGADAVGYAYRSPGDVYPTVVKQRTPASHLLDRVSVPAEATQLLVHVRDYTKGHPSIAANNHPVRHGPVVGVHNGIIVNDDELLAEHPCARAEPRMTVDSEAIFALAAHSRNDPCAFEELQGSMAAAWLDEREPELLFLARGVGRPLWLGEGRDGVFLGSTRSPSRPSSATARSGCAGARSRRGRASPSAPASSRGARPASGSSSRRPSPGRARRGARLLPQAPGDDAAAA